MNYTISGANGFVGKSLMRALYGAHCLTALVRNPHSQSFKEEFSRAKVREVFSFYTKEDYLSTLDGCDTFFHLAGMKGINKTNLQASASVRINIEATLKLLDASLEIKPQRVVFLSSQKAVKRDGVYGASKFIVEKLLEEYQLLNPKTLYQTVRCGNILHSPESVVEIWRTAILRGEPIKVKNRSSTVFLCTVEDCTGFLQECNEPLLVPVLKAASLTELAEATISKYGPSQIIEELNAPEHEYLTDEICSSEAERFTAEELLSII